MGPWQRETWLESSILLAAIVLNGLLLAVAVPALETQYPRTYGTGFVEGYDLIARNVADGRGYRWEPEMAPTMTREPGYPLFLAGIFKAGGDDMRTVRLVNWLLAAGIAFATMSLAREVTGDRKTALIASLLFLFHPGTLIAEARAAVEMLFILAAVVFLLVLHRAVMKASPWYYLAAGLTLGAVVQVRSTPFLFPGLLLMYLILTAKGFHDRLRACANVAILVIGMAMVMAPWIVRNYRLVHRLVPTATIVGLNLHEGQYACRNLPFDGDFYTTQTEAGRIRAGLAAALGLRFEGLHHTQFFYDAQDEWKFTDELVRRARQEYIQAPAFLAGCMGRNLFNFWFLGKTWRVTRLNMILQVPLLALTVAGLWLLWKRGALRRMGIILLFSASILMVHLPVVAEARHSIAVLPFLAIPASVAIAALRRGSRVSERWTRTET